MKSFDEKAGSTAGNHATNQQNNYNFLDERMVHIGKEIRMKLKERQRTVVWFSRQLSCSRTNVYKIFEKPNVDTALLLRISLILEHDFFLHFSNQYGTLRREAATSL